MSAALVPCSGGTAQAQQQPLRWAQSETVDSMARLLSGHVRLRQHAIDIGEQLAPLVTDSTPVSTRVAAHEPVSCVPVQAGITLAAEHSRSDRVGADPSVPLVDVSEPPSNPPSEARVPTLPMCPCGLGVSISVTQLRPVTAFAHHIGVRAPLHQPLRTCGVSSWLLRPGHLNLALFNAAFDYLKQETSAHPRATPDVTVVL